MKDAQGNTYHAWGIMEIARGFIIPETVRHTRTEAYSAFCKQNSAEWIRTHEQDFKAVKIEFVIVKEWNKKRKRYE